MEFEAVEVATNEIEIRDQLGKVICSIVNTTEDVLTVRDRSNAEMIVNALNRYVE